MLKLKEWNIYTKQMQQYRPKSFVLVGGWVRFVSYSSSCFLLLFKQQDFRADSQDGFSPSLRLISQACHTFMGTRPHICRRKLDWHSSVMKHIWMLDLPVACKNENSLLASSKLHETSCAVWPRADLLQIEQRFLVSLLGSKGICLQGEA